MRESRWPRSLGGLLLGVSVAASTWCCDDKMTKSAAADAATTNAAGSVPAAASAPEATPTTAPTGSSPAAAAPVPAAIAAQHVLVAYKGADKAPKGVTRSKADAKKRADEVAAKARSGTDFSALVAEYSDDPAAKERQGSVGKFTREKMAKPFSDAAFQLKVDEVSAPVETPFGYHVIKRNQ
jgi:hypothetical protein